ncbi:MAG TPA: IclR family transcriptional regulator C-terminal domain-containing protein [Candidatus Binatia bacterium]|nr:IclR family transcriptional regulator C-terminal domain-containing protein [Candidatus Binatia bacterium]
MSTDLGLEYTRSVARGLQVLGCFSERRPVMTISTVATECGLTRATARRILHTLVRLGFVSADGDYFRLTPRVLSIGYSYLSSLALPELAHPRMEQLVAAVHESSSLAVLDGCEIVYVARVATGRMSHSLTVGTRLPAFATALGRALLACLTEDELPASLPEEPFPRFTDRTIGNGASLRDALAGVRSRGFAINDGELEEGQRSIAVPIRGARGRAEAALNVAVDAGRVSVDDLRTGILPELREAAAAIENDLRHHPVGRSRGGDAAAPDVLYRVAAAR